MLFLNTMSLFLNELLELDLPLNPYITGMSVDSHTVTTGQVFFAIAGRHTHGEVYIDDALQRGAVAVVKEAADNQVIFSELDGMTGKVPCIAMPNLAQKLGSYAAKFYHYPTQEMQVIGVTGTNGKTSVTHFISQILQQLTQQPCGLIGTLGYGVYGKLHAGLHTTPEAIRLQSLFAQLHDQQVKTVVMEVSSHGLAQGRVNATKFDIAVFTNLTRDHLDYHGTMQAYGEAKQILFHFPEVTAAVINADDEFGQKLLRDLPARVHPLTYSLEHENSDVFAQFQPTSAGYVVKIHSAWGQGEFVLPLLGKFNIYNMLAALTVLLPLGLPFAQVLTACAHLTPVAGRMEKLTQPQQPMAIIDYAHTPDALQKVLVAVRQHCAGKLWCVFGCGGDRDRGKRAVMGQIAQQYADAVVLTDDNPRHEASEAIIADISVGCPNPIAIIPMREQAILYALAAATMNDAVVIAGKGHEDYQEVGGQRFPFSDKTVIEKWFGQS